MNQLTLDPHHLKTILLLLKDELPPNAKVWVFGSRSRGDARKFSDLDLVIDLGEGMTIDLLASLRLAFEESNLPYKVDFVDWTALSEDFRKKIKKDLVRLN